MKVIVAGYPKTGTKSLNAALSKLGYKVYDYTENIYCLEKYYKKIFKEGWTTEDFKEMYENIDAVVDQPAMYFWEEILKAFPDAKIILSVRDSEEVWFESVRKQIKVMDRYILLRLVKMFSPTARRILRDVVIPGAYASFGMMYQSDFSFRINTWLNKNMWILKYRAHNAYVMEKAPADKLLVYQCKEGWKPLCDFLGVPVPDQPFPHKNVRGGIMKVVFKTNPIAKTLLREAIVCSTCLLLTVSVSGYFVYKIGPRGILKSLQAASLSMYKYF